MRELYITSNMKHTIYNLNPYYKVSWQGQFEADEEVFIIDRNSSIYTDMFV